MDTPQTPPSDKPDHDNSQAVSLTMDEVVAVLTEGAMAATHGMMRYSSNYTFLVSVEKDAYQIPAIYKPQKGERPLWDFPTGTLYMRERASYLTSAQLGWSVVPPTVVREGEHGVGSVQFFIEHDPEKHYFTFDERVAPQLARLCLFDVLVNNADRKGGHCLLDASGQLWGIDHGITFNEDHKLRTVIWDFAGQPIPQILIDDVQRLCSDLQTADNPFRCQLNTLLSPREIEAFQRRIDRVLNTKTFPTPGPGPNYPWPAV